METYRTGRKGMLWFISTLVLLLIAKTEALTVTPSWSYFRIGLVGREFNYLRSSITRIPENTTLEFVYINVNPGTSVSSLAAATTALKNLELTAIVHKCDYQLMVMARALNLPYFLVGGVPDCFEWVSRPPNCFDMSVTRNMTVSSLVAYFNYIGVNKMAIFMMEGDTQMLPRLLYGKEFMPLEIKINASHDDITNVIASKRTELIAIKHFVVFFNDSMQHLQSPILNAAMYQQLVRTGMSWYMRNHNATASLIELYKPTGVGFVTFQPVYGNEVDDAAVVKELAIHSVIFMIDVIGKKVPPDFVQTLKQGRFHGNQTQIYFGPDGTFLNNSMLMVAQVKGRNPQKFTWNAAGAIRPLQLLNTDQYDNIWRVAVIGNTIFYNKTAAGPQGIAVDVLKAIKKLFPALNYFFLEPPDGLYGSIGENGSWNGLIAMLIQNKADVIMSDLTLNAKRSEVVTFSVTVTETGYGLLYQNQNKTFIAKMIWYITVPFSSNVWILLIICYLLLSFVLWITDIISPNKSKTSSAFTWGQSCFVVFAAFVMAKLELAPRMLSVRIFVLLLWFATLVMVATYTAMIYPLLLTRPKYIPIKTLERLIGSDMQHCFSTGTSTYSQFKSSSERDPTSEEGQVYLKSNKTIGFNISAEVLADPKLVFIGGLQSVKYQAYQNCELTYVSISSSDTSGFALRKDWAYKDKAHKYLQDVKSSGRLDSIYGAWFGHNRCAPSVARVRAIDWNDVLGLMVLLGTGCVLAFISAMVEYFYKKCVLCVQRHTGNILKFGNIYSATVILVEAEGIWLTLKGETQEYFMPCENLFPARDKKIAPSDLGINIGNKMRIKYFGNDPQTGERMFLRAT